MNTILTDDEISEAGKNCFWPLDEDAPKFARAIEAAVLAKLREQEPAAVVQALEALDELEAAARGDEPFNHFAAPLIRQALENSMLAAAPEAPAASTPPTTTQEKPHYEN